MNEPLKRILSRLEMAALTTITGACGIGSTVTNGPPQANVASADGTPILTGAGSTSCASAGITDYQSLVEEALQESCNNCHSPGNQPPDLSTFANAQANGAAIATDVVRGSMPPDSSVSASFKSMITAWAGAGFAAQSPPPAAATDFQTQVEQGLEASCVSCHSPGKQAPDLSTFASAQANGVAIVLDVFSGTMPPGGTVPAAFGSLIAAWANAGFAATGTMAASTPCSAPAPAPAPAPAAPAPAPASPAPAPAPPPTSTSSGDGGSCTGLPTISFQTQVESALQSECVTCHSPGNQAPDLSTFAAAQANGAAIASSIRTGSMPPDGTPSSAFKILIDEWAASGFATSCPEPSAATGDQQDQPRHHGDDSN